MAIKILRDGIGERVPEEAQYCPTCKSGPIQGVLQFDENKKYFQQCQVGIRMPALAPTFTCPYCGCIWQWTPDKYEEGVGGVNDTRG